jgi:PST family polysaccharide transporter
MVGNLIWLLIDRGVRIFTDILLGAFVARTLGTTDFGSLTYAYAFAMLAYPVAMLGLDTHVIQLLVRGESRERVLGTTFILKLSAGAIAFVACAGIAALIHRDDPSSLLIVVIASTSLMFKSLEVIDLYFQSRLEANRLIAARAAAATIAAAIKIAFLYMDPNVYYIAIVTSCEILLTGFFALGLMQRAELGIRKWQFDFELARSMLARRLPVMLSAIFVSAYVRAGPLLLRWMSGTHEAGIYGAAYRLMEVAYFLPTAIVSSLTPLLVNAHRKSERQFEETFLAVTTMLTWIGIILAAVLALLSDTIILRLYSSEFAASSATFAILLLTFPFVFAAAANNVWFTLSNEELSQFLRVLIAAVACIAVTALLIPRFGARGAAYAMVMTQVLAVLILNLWSPKTRLIAKRFLQSLSPRGFVAVFKIFVTRST